jgi:Bacterial SH3 domain
MKNLFPNIETAIIFVFIICVMLWGVSRCNKKKDALATQTAIEGAATTQIDTSLSPAARRSPSASPTATPAPPPLPTPNQAVVETPPSQPTTVQNPTLVTPTAAPVPPTTATTPIGPKTAVSTAPTATAPAPASGTSLYVLINGLNVRAKPDLKAKSLGKLKINDQVYFMNEVTPEAQTVRLIDKTEVTKPWFKIKTKKGTVGWVHGSGVDFYKRKPQGVL